MLSEFTSYGKYDGCWSWGTGAVRLPLFHSLPPRVRTPRRPFIPLTRTPPLIRTPLDRTPVVTTSVSEVVLSSDEEL